MMALMPVSCWNIAMNIVTSAAGRYLREKSADQDCPIVTLLATSAATQMSSYSIETSSVPRTRASTARPSSLRPRSISELGVSGRMMPAVGVKVGVGWGWGEVGVEGGGRTAGCRRQSAAEGSLLHKQAVSQAGSKPSRQTCRVKKQQLSSAHFQ